MRRLDPDVLWNLVLAAGDKSDSLKAGGRLRAFGVDAAGHLAPLDADGPEAALVWMPGIGWQSRIAPEDPGTSLVDLYLPLCSATKSRPVTVGHLGQSLDGFIATHSGDSQFVTGESNIAHLHRMRALCGAVIVGAGTVAADDPQLTTRLVAGPNPLRVVLDPARRLSPTYRVFTDAAAPTLYICARTRIRPGETRVGEADIVGIDERGAERDLGEVIDLLRGRGCSRIFVEGGGVTVSAFLEANLLNRLQIAIAPLLIGDGRPAIRLAPHASLRDCRRPGYRVFQMGGDVLFDCDLDDAAPAESSQAPSITRII